MTIITGGTAIEQILAVTELIIQPGNYMLVGIEPVHRPRLEAALINLSDHFFQYTVEADVLTLLLAHNDWANIGNEFPGAKVEGPLKLFTFSVAMDWQVVGFLAAITSLLAQANIPLGAVCGYYRDHLFIAGKYAAQAQTLLQAQIDRCKTAKS